MGEESRACRGEGIDGVWGRTSACLRLAGGCCGKRRRRREPGVPAATHGDRTRRRDHLVCLASPCRQVSDGTVVRDVCPAIGRHQVRPILDTRIGGGETGVRPAHEAVVAKNVIDVELDFSEESLERSRARQPPSGRGRRQGQAPPHRATRPTTWPRSRAFEARDRPACHSLPQQSRCARCGVGHA
jgi:hypothetical protein